MRSLDRFGGAAPTPMTEEQTTARSDIGVLNEGALHRALKAHYLQGHGEAEVPLGNHVADVIRDGVIYEIQTSSFSGLRSKMQALVEQRPVVLVHPIAGSKTLLQLREGLEGEVTRRRSPKHGRLTDILGQLVYLPELLSHHNFSVEAVLIDEEELREFDPKARRGRGGWRRRGRHLVSIRDTLRITGAADIWRLLSKEPEQPFTTADLAKCLGRSKGLAQQMAYCLRQMEHIEVCGKQGNALLYQRPVDRPEST